MKRAVRAAMAAPSPLRRLTRAWGWATLLAVPLAGMAPGATAQVLALPAAMRAALASHPSLAQRQGEIAAAAQDLKAAEWKRYPTVSAEVSQTLHKQTLPFNPYGATPQHVLRVDQPLWTFGRLSAEIDSAAVRRAVAELQLVETEQDLLLRVGQAYLELARQVERERLASRNVDEHQRLVELIERRLAGGVSSEVDVALARARLAQAQAERSLFRSAAQSARTTLVQLTGLEVREVAPLGAPGRALRWASVDAALRAALDHSPVVQRLAASVQLAEHEAALRRAGTLPQVIGRVEHYGGNGQLQPADRLMVMLQYQPGAGLSQFSLADAAVARVDAARAGLAAGRLDLTERVTSQYNEARAMAEQIAPNQVYLQSTTDVMDSYLRQYTAGRKTWQEVLNAQRELTQAAYALTDALASATLAHLRLDVLTGLTQRAALDDVISMVATARPAVAANSTTGAGMAATAAAGAPAAAALPVASPEIRTQALPAVGTSPRTVASTVTNTEPSAAPGTTPAASPSAGSPARP